MPSHISNWIWWPRISANLLCDWKLLLGSILLIVKTVFTDVGAILLLGLNFMEVEW